MMMMMNEAITALEQLLDWEAALDIAVETWLCDNDELYKAQAAEKAFMNADHTTKVYTKGYSRYSRFNAICATCGTVPLQNKSSITHVDLDYAVLAFKAAKKHMERFE